MSTRPIGAARSLVRFRRIMGGAAHAISQSWDARKTEAPEKNDGRACPSHPRHRRRVSIPVPGLDPKTGTTRGGWLRRVQQIEILLVDGHVLAERDRRRLRAADEVHPAPGVARVAVFLDNRVVVL